MSVRVSSSSSEVSALQDKVVDVLTLLLGLMVTVDTSGSVLAITKLVSSDPVSPSSSVAVAVQVMVSPGETIDEERVRLAEVPRVVPSSSLVHR